jgi:hypothetical protein
LRGAGAGVPVGRIIGRGGIGMRRERDGCEGVCFGLNDGVMTIS